MQAHPPRLPHADSVKDTAAFNREVFAFEDARVSELNHLIHTLDIIQKNLGLPKSKRLLQDSLQFLMEAETLEEMDTYRSSFLAAIEGARLHDVLEVDNCIEGFRETADLFQLMSRSRFSLNKKLSDDEMDDIFYFANIAQARFLLQAQKLEKDFLNEIRKNEKLLSELRANQKPGHLNPEYAEQLEKIKYLEKLNTKYKAGIKHIAVQTGFINEADGILNQFKAATRIEELHVLRSELSRTFAEIRTESSRASYNHFLDRCKTEIDQLCFARSRYLKSESIVSRHENIQATWNVISPVTNLLPAVKPAQIIATSADAMDLTNEMRGHVQAARKKVIAGDRNFMKPALRVSTAAKAWNILKKVGSVLLSVAALAGSALLCLTGVGVPKGIALASTAVSALNSVKSGSDYFTDLKKIHAHTQDVTQKVTSLEQQHEALATVSKIKKQSTIANPTPTPEHSAHHQQNLGSEAKIEMLLMGHRSIEPLSMKQIQQLESGFGKPPVDNQANNPDEKYLPSKKTELMKANEDEKEGEGETHIDHPHL